MHLLKATPSRTCSAPACALRCAVAGIPSAAAVQHVHQARQERPHEGQVPPRPYAVRLYALRCQERTRIRSSLGFGAAGDYERATKLFGSAIVPGRNDAWLVQSASITHLAATACTGPAADVSIWCWNAAAPVLRPRHEGRTAAGRLLPRCRAGHDISRSPLEQRLQHAPRRQCSCGLQHCFHTKRSTHQVGARRIVAPCAPTALLSGHDVD